MMLYILKNQHDQLLNRQLEWVAGCPASQLFCSPHRDIAINQLIELNSRDINLRAEIIACETDAKGFPVVNAAAASSATAAQTA